MEVKFPRSFAPSPSYYLNQPIPVVPLVTWHSLISLPTPGPEHPQTHAHSYPHTISLLPTRRSPQNTTAKWRQLAKS